MRSCVLLHVSWESAECKLDIMPGQHSLHLLDSLAANWAQDMARNHPCHLLRGKAAGP